jgi:hypothetical protein
MRCVRNGASGPRIGVGAAFGVASWGRRNSRRFGRPAPRHCRGTGWAWRTVRRPLGSFWQGVFQLAGLIIVTGFGTFIYQRRQARLKLREELIDSINQFAIQLYKPRKLYQAILDQTCDPLAQVAEPAQREARRLELGRALPAAETDPSDPRSSNRGPTEARRLE